MNIIKFSIIDDQIKFNRLNLIQTIKNFLQIYNTSLTHEEKQQIVESIINKIEIFERKLSDKLKIYLRHEKEVNSNYIDSIILKAHSNIGYFISICLQQEYKDLTL